MRADKECLDCCRKKAAGLLEQYHVSEFVRALVVLEVDKVLAETGDKSAPVLMAEVLSVVEKYLPVSDAYEIPKQKYNQILMEWEEAVRTEVLEQKDRFLAGIQCAITGNYIDFGAMSDVNKEKLEELLQNRRKTVLDETELENLREEILHAKKLVYITDNAGEIVLDKIFIQVLKEMNKTLEICVLVRGVPVLNDATYMDAQEVGIAELVKVVSNGTDVPGTPLDKISEEAFAQIDSADLCIAKGQGNFETLRGCGRNIYYLFLCKCELFVKKFQVERFTPVLNNENRIVQFI